MSPSQNIEPFEEFSNWDHLRNLFRQLDASERKKAVQVEECARVWETFGPIDGIRQRFYKHKDPGVLIAFYVLTFPSKKEGIFTQQMALYCPEKDAGLLEESLIRTQVIDFKELVILLGIDPLLMTVFRNAAEKRDAQIVDWDYGNFFAISPQKAVQFDLSHDEDVYCRPLTPDEALLPYQTWRYHNIKKYDVFRKIVEQMPSMGVFRNSDDRLVSWIILSDWGAMGYLYTVEEFRRKRYASLVVKALSAKLAKYELTPFVCVEDYNNGSMSCFTDLGFEVVNRSLSLAWLPRDAPAEMQNLEEFFLSD